MRIGICDDDSSQLRIITGFCRQYAEENHLECNIVTFSSGEEVLDYKGSILDLLLLDIEMDGIDGIKVMKEIENKDIVWRIVFISSHVEMVWSTFGVKTLDFGRKPISYEMIKKWLNIAIRESSEDITIQLNKGNKLKMSQIAYLESSGNYSFLYTKNGKLLISGNLKYWETRLALNQFIRVHKSYLVNIDYIDRIHDKVYLKENFIELSIGRNYKKSIIEKYNHFIIKRIRGRLL